MIITKNQPEGQCRWIGAAFTTDPKYFLWYFVQFDEHTFGIMLRQVSAKYTRSDLCHYLRSSAGEQYSLSVFNPDVKRFVWNTSFGEMAEILEQHAEWVFVRS